MLCQKILLSGPPKSSNTSEVVLPLFGFSRLQDRPFWHQRIVLKWSRSSGVEPGGEICVHSLSRAISMVRIAVDIAECNIKCNRLFHDVISLYTSKPVKCPPIYIASAWDGVLRFFED